MRYNQVFSNVYWIETPVEKDYTRSSYHNYVIKVSDRYALREFLAERDIQTSVHYRPLHLTTLAGRQESLPVAEEVWHKILTLPLYPGLTDREVEKVIETVLEFGDDNYTT